MRTGPHEVNDLGPRPDPRMYRRRPVMPDDDTSNWRQIQGAVLGLEINIATLRMRYVPLVVIGGD